MTGADDGSLLDFVRRLGLPHRLPTAELTSLGPPAYATSLTGPRNEHGFRSIGFDRRGDFNVAFLGCSWVEGWGVAPEATFPQRLAARLSRAHGIDVVAWNLGQSGTGLDTVLRFVPSVCRVLKPDLAVVVVTSPERREQYSANGQPVLCNVPHASKAEAGEVERPQDELDVLRGYALARSRYDDAAHMLRNILAIDAHFAAAEIAWTYSWIDTWPTCSLMGALQETGALPDRPFLGTKFTLLDQTAEGSTHPGPASHQAFADQIADWVEQRGLLPVHDRAGRPTATNAQPALLRRLGGYLPAVLRRSRKVKKANAESIHNQPEDMYTLW